MKEILRLKKKLKERGLTLRLLSRKSGVAYATVYGLFTGTRSAATARAESIKKLADALDMSMDELYEELISSEEDNNIMKNFTLMWKDEVISDVSFSGGEAVIERHSTDPAKQIFYKDRLLLLEFGDIIKSRCWEENRADIARLLSAIGVAEYNPYEIVQKTHGLMSQDPIWFRFDGEKLTYKEVRRIMNNWFRYTGFI